MNEEEFAELVREHPELAKHFMWMSPGKDGRRGYYRRIPRTYYNRRARPVSQLQTQIIFGKAAHLAYGKKGFDDKGVPIVASEIKKEMKGKRYRKPKWWEIVKQLRESLKEVVEVVEVS